MEGGFVGARVSRLAAVRLVLARSGSGDPRSETDAVGISGVSAEGDALVLDFSAPCLATEFVEIFSGAGATTLFVLFVADTCCWAEFVRELTDACTESEFVCDRWPAVQREC